LRAEKPYMKKQSILLIAFFCVFALLVSCNKSDNNATQAPAITGVFTRDINAEPTGTMGNPNTNTNFNGMQIVCYPNPCYGELNVSLSLPQATTVKSWIVAGAYKNPPDSFLLVNPLTGNEKVAVKVQNQSLYSHQSNPPLDTTQTFNTGNNELSYNTSGLPSGFYRLYMVINSDTLYDNIWVSN
jgi:hypothetical protein